MDSARERPAGERLNAAMMAMAKIVTEAARREQAMYLRLVKEVNAMTRGRTDDHK